MDEVRSVTGSVGLPINKNSSNLSTVEELSSSTESLSFCQRVKRIYYKEKPFGSFFKCVGNKLQST